MPCPNEAGVRQHPVQHICQREKIEFEEFVRMKERTNKFGHPLPTIDYELISWLDVGLRESLEKGELFLYVVWMDISVGFYPGYVGHGMRRRGWRRF